MVQPTQIYESVRAAIVGTRLDCQGNNSLIIIKNSLIVITF